MFFKKVFICILKHTTGDFSGGPVVKNLPSNGGNLDSVPGRETKIPHAKGQLSSHATTKEPTHHKEYPVYYKLRSDAANK